MRNPYRSWLDGLQLAGWTPRGKRVEHQTDEYTHHHPDGGVHQALPELIEMLQKRHLSASL